MPRTSMKLRMAAKLAAGAAAAGIAVAACGPVQMGAAATLGSQRISAAQLSAQAENLKAGYQKYKNKIQLQYPADQMTQQALGWMVRFRVSDRMAQRQDITVTPGEVQGALTKLNDQIKQGGGTVTLPMLAVANGLPPDLISDLGRYQAIQQKVLSRLDGGQLPSEQAAQQTLQAQFAAVQCRASKSLDIKINPQFGELDYSKLSVVPAPSSLSASQPSPGPSASPSAKPRLTPPC